VKKAPRVAEREGVQSGCTEAPVLCNILVARDLIALIVIVGMLWLYAILKL
jgi:hypothetical protein